MAQVAEHILGKDEVTSSNLVISSINPRSYRNYGDFCFCNCIENRAKNVKKILYYLQITYKIE